VSPVFRVRLTVEKKNERGMRQETEGMRTQGRSGEGKRRTGRYVGKGQVE
jgi:hypothetical protein